MHNPSRQNSFMSMSDNLRRQLVPSRSLPGSLAVGIDDSNKQVSSQSLASAATAQSFLRAVAVDPARPRTASDNFALKVKRELRLSRRDPLERLNADEFTLNKLNLKDVDMVGRQEEKRILNECFRGLLKCPPHQGGVRKKAHKLVTISGYSGTGKTLLAHQLRNEIIERDGFFCVGKFDLQNRFEPYIAFVQAFSQLADQILRKGGTFATEMRSRIEEAVGTDRHVLTEVVPKLAELFGEPMEDADSPTEASVEKRAIRLQFLFRKFVRAVCGNGNPLVVVLDDLQWADSSSLDLVEALLTDHEDPLLLLIGTFRSNEIDEDHVVVKKIRALELKGVTEKRILLENLDAAAVLSIVSTALRAPEDLVRSLAMIVYGKTHGNPFFVIQFLKSLVDKNLLTFSFGTLKWSWDEGRVHELLVTENVADLLTSNLQSLSDDLQQLLQISACLGQRFDEEILAIAYEKMSNTSVLPKVSRARSVQSMFDLAVKEGIFQRAGSTYVFAHDQIQEAAFNLIKEDSRLLLKLRIGEQLLTYGKRSDVDCLFLGVDLCNAAFELLDSAQKLGLAKYNLLAGEKAMKQSAFVAAKQYFESGLKCLGTDAVTDSHSEWLNLTTGIVESTYCCGDIDTMQQHVERVMNASCPFEDKIRVYSTRIHLLTSQERFREAMSTGLHVLKKMGMTRVSEFPGTLSVLKELVYTRLFIKKYNREKLVHLPELADKKRIMAMEIIDMMASASFAVSPNLFVILFLRSLQWSVKLGVSKYSPTAFATFGTLLTAMGDAKEGGVFGEIALELSERLKARDTVSLTTFAVYAYLHHWSHDLRSCIKPLLYCYQVGMDTGNVETAMLGAVQHDWAVFFTASRPLERLLSDVESHTSRAREYNQKGAETFGLRLQQLLLNLLGRSVDPLVLTGSAMNQQAMYKMARDEKSKVIEMDIDCCRLQLAFLLGHYKRAAKLLKGTADLGTKENRGAMLVPRIHMYRALTFLALARAGIERRANLRRAGGIAKVIRGWHKDGNVNVLHMHKLILAAEASCRRTRGKKPQTELVKTLYREATQAASRCGFLQDKALCHEWVGRYYLEQENDAYWAAYHLGNAVQFYKEWGATALVSRLMKDYGKLLAGSLEGSELGDCILSQSQLFRHRSIMRNSIG